MKYLIIHKSTIQALQERVNDALQEGWKLQGGVAIGMDQGYQCFIQAMYKE